MDTTNRNIDVTTTSMTIVELNNMISSMRHLVKRSKVQVIHKLTDQIKKYKAKKGSDEQKQANENKVARLVNEMNAVKEVNFDEVTKFSLSNTLTPQSVRNEHSVSTKAKVRLSCQKVISDKVLTWRKEHEDWKSLAAFIQQHIGRRLKPKKEKTVDKQKPESKPQGKDSKISTSSSDEDIIKQQTNMDSITEELIDDNKNSVNPKTENIDQLKSKKKSKKNTNVEVDSDSEDNDRTPGPSNEIERHKLILEEPKELSGIETKKLTILSDVKKSNKRSLNVGGCNESINRGEVVIKRLKLDQMEDEIDGTKKQEKNVEFLFEDDNKDTESIHEIDNEKDGVDIKKRSKDKFFITGSGSEEDSSEISDDDNEMSNEDVSENLHESENEELSDAKFKKAKRTMIDSTFVGSLLHTKNKRHSSKGSTKVPRSNTDGMKSGKYSKPMKQPLKHKEHPKHLDKTKFKSSKQFEKRGAVHKGRLDQEHKNSTSNVSKPNITTGTEKLHPSWEASKKRKQELTTLAPFQGKKTVFDD